MPIREILAKNMKRLRASKGWTQAELAERSSFSHGMIRQLETGTTWIGSEGVSKISEAFGVAETELFVDPGHVSKPSIREAWKIINEYLENQKQI